MENYRHLWRFVEICRCAGHSSMPLQPSKPPLTAVPSSPSRWSPRAPTMATPTTTAATPTQGYGAWGGGPALSARSDAPVLDTFDWPSASARTAPAVALRVAFEDNKVCFELLFGACRRRHRVGGVATERSRRDASLGTFRSTQALGVRRRHAPKSS